MWHYANHNYYRKQEKEIYKKKTQFTKRLKGPVSQANDNYKLIKKNSERERERERERDQIKSQSIAHLILREMGELGKCLERREMRRVVVDDDDVGPTLVL